MYDDWWMNIYRNILVHACIHIYTGASIPLSIWCILCISPFSSAKFRHFPLSPQNLRVFWLNWCFSLLPLYFDHHAFSCFTHTGRPYIDIIDVYSTTLKHKLHQVRRVVPRRATDLLPWVNARWLSRHCLQFPFTGFDEMLMFVDHHDVSYQVLKWLTKRDDVIKSPGDAV